jgi:hypothetical protein
VPMVPRVPAPPVLGVPPDDVTLVAPPTPVAPPLSVMPPVPVVVCDVVPPVSTVPPEPELPPSTSWPPDPGAPPVAALPPVAPEPAPCLPQPSKRQQLAKNAAQTIWTRVDLVEGLMAYYLCRHSG